MYLSNDSGNVDPVPVCRSADRVFVDRVVCEVTAP